MQQKTISATILMGAHPLEPTTLQDLYGCTVTIGSTLALNVLLGQLLGRPTFWVDLAAKDIAEVRFALAALDIKLECSNATGEGVLFPHFVNALNA